MIHFHLPVAVSGYAFPFLVWPQNVMTIEALMVLGEDQVLHFVRQNQEALLSCDTSN